MFGFGKRKSEPEKPSRRSAESKERKNQSRAQLGFLAGVGDDGDIDNLMGNMDVGDDDLEEELAMLLDGNSSGPRRPKAPSPRKPQNSGKGKPVVNPVFDVEKDDIDDQDDDDIDLDDPDLEAELGDILGVSGSKPSSNLPTPDDDDSEESSATSTDPKMSKDELIHVLQERLALYENAKRASDSAGDSAKSRRFARGVKTLNEQLSKAKAGRVVDEADIPPVVSINVIKKEPAPPPAEPPQVPPRPSVPEPVEVPKPAVINFPFKTDDVPNIPSKLPEPLIPDLAPPPVPPRAERKEETEPPVAPISISIDPAVENRLKEYKRVAVAMKRQGNVQEALKYLKLSKDLETAAKTSSVNLDDYPSVESMFSKEPESNTAEIAGPSIPEPTPVEPAVQVADQPAEGPPADIFGAPPPPTSVMDALQQRLDKYKSEVEKANAASNSSKARRMGRIVKQYEEAIGLYKKGRPVPFDELPNPPGFAPIPVGPAVAPTPAPAPSAPVAKPAVQVSVEPAAPSTPEKKPKTDGSSPACATGTSPGGSTISRAGKPVSKLTLQEKQLKAIQVRQQQFKEAALNAKKRGDLNQAREFLRTAKGFDQLIQAAQSGLPVDMATLPAPPEAVAELNNMEDDNFEVVSASDCIMPDSNAAEIYSKLENDLKQQLKMCMRTRDHFKSIGDVPSANRFESMALESKRDLDTLRLAMKKKSDIPKYHYENRIFSITECNTDVGEDEIEISIVQGVNYKVSNPNDVDTFVKIELPYPSAEEVQVNKTAVVKNTNSPQYNATFKMNINRTARPFQRFVHRHGVKCEIWSRGALCSGGFICCKFNSGFLRGNTLIGTATVKLLPLETKCTLHDGFDILDGRKVVGKLEAKVRIREPVLTKQITQKKEKWLSIDRT